MITSFGKFYVNSLVISSLSLFQTVRPPAVTRGCMSLESSGADFGEENHPAR
jgi:hypothetical protein